MEHLTNIYQAISAVMADVGAVGKNSKNTQQNFMFRGIDAVMNALNPALIKHKVFVVPEVLEMTREERTTKNGSALIYTIARMRYTFYAEDGSNVQAVVLGEAMDSGDKSCNKAMAIAFKYACFQVFCIPTEELKDPDAESHEVIPAPEDVGKLKIDETKAQALKNACAADRVDLTKLLALYKCKDASELNEAQFLNINQHWAEVKKRCPAVKNGNSAEEVLFS